MRIVSLSLPLVSTNWFSKLTLLSGVNLIDLGCLHLVVLAVKSAESLSALG